MFLFAKSLLASWLDQPSRNFFTCNIGTESFSRHVGTWSVQSGGLKEPLGSQREQACPEGRIKASGRALYRAITRSACSPVREMRIQPYCIKLLKCSLQVHTIGPLSFPSFPYFFYFNLVLYPYGILTCPPLLP